MKRIVLITAGALVAGTVFAATMQQIVQQDEYPTGLNSFGTKVNSNFNSLTNGHATLAVGSVSATGAITAVAFVTNDTGLAVGSLVTTGNVVVGTTANIHGAGYIVGGVGIGAASNKVTIAAASGNTVIAGTLAVTGVATLTAVPILNASLGTAGTVVGAPMTNMPSGVSTNAVWIKVMNGANTYYVPGYLAP